MKKFIVEVEGYGAMAPVFETKKQAEAWAKRQFRWNDFKWAVKNV